MAALVLDSTVPSPVLAPLPFADQIADELDAALAEHRGIVLQIRRDGPTGLILIRERTERRIIALTQQLAEARS